MGDVPATDALRNIYQWDFSVTNSVNVVLILFNLQRCIQNRYGPIEKKNKLTWMINCGILSSLASLEFRSVMQMLLTEGGSNINQLTEYTLNSFACLFFSMALALQYFEWDMLAQLIQFQGVNDDRELLILQTKLNKKELKKWKVTKGVLWGVTGYHIFKIIVPFTALYACNAQNLTQDQCKEKTANRIAILLGFDMAFCFMYLIYGAYCLFTFLYYSRKYSQLEFKKHRVYLAITGTGLLLGWPICVMGDHKWMQDFCLYSRNRQDYYLYFFSRTFPCVVLLLAKPIEDCFNCFNRLTPKPYSFFQYSQIEIDRENNKNRRESLDKIIIESEKFNNVNEVFDLRHG